MAAARHFSKCSLTIWGRPLGMADSVAATAANQSTPTAVYANIVQTVQPRCIGGVPAGLGSHYAGLPSTYVLGYHMPPLRGCRLAIRSVSSSPGKQVPHRSFRPVRNDKDLRRRLVLCLS